MERKTIITYAAIGTALVAILYFAAVHDWDGSPQQQEQPPAPVASCQDRLTECRYKLEKAGGNMMQEPFEAITCESQIKECLRLRAACSVHEQEVKNRGAAPCKDRKAGVIPPGTGGIECEPFPDGNINWDTCVQTECCGVVFNGSYICIAAAGCKLLKNGSCDYPITNSCDFTKINREYYNGKWHI